MHESIRLRQLSVKRPYHLDCCVHAVRVGTARKFRHDFRRSRQEEGTNPRGQGSINAGA